LHDGGERKPEVDRRERRSDEVDEDGEGEGQGSRSSMKGGEDRLYGDEMDDGESWTSKAGISISFQE
jgi:hypothetical protein